MWLVWSVCVSSAGCTGTDTNSAGCAEADTSIEGRDTNNTCELTYDLHIATTQDQLQIIGINVNWVTCMYHYIEYVFI